MKALDGIRALADKHAVSLDAPRVPGAGIELVPQCFVAVVVGGPWVHLQHARLVPLGAPYGVFDNTQAHALGFAPLDKPPPLALKRSPPRKIAEARDAHSALRRPLSVMVAAAYRNESLNRGRRRVAQPGRVGGTDGVERVGALVPQMRTTSGPNTSSRSRNHAAPPAKDA